MSISELISKLSREDHERYFSDLICYGQAFVVTTEDGGVRYVPPSEWMAVPDVGKKPSK